MVATDIDDNSLHFIYAIFRVQLLPHHLKMNVIACTAMMGRVRPVGRMQPARASHATRNVCHEYN